MEKDYRILERLKVVAVFSGRYVLRERQHVHRKLRLSNSPQPLDRVPREGGLATAA
jgi:hypothetical protein